MIRIARYVPIFLMALLMTVVIPQDAVAIGPELQETDVAIVREEYYNEGDSREDRASSEYAPGYHNLFVTADKNTITFHNYAVLHDERVQSTEYYLVLHIVVVEHGKIIERKYTHTVQYSPPYDNTWYQTITFDVDYQGVGVHEYGVGSEFQWYHVRPDGTSEDHPYKDSTGFEQAYVHEIIDPIPVQMEALI